MIDRERKDFLQLAIGGNLTDDQCFAAESAHSWERNLLLRSCNGAGKTALLASFALEYLHQYEDITVIAVSKSMTHLQTNFMRQLKKQAKRIPQFMNKKINKFNFEPAPGKNLYAISPNNIESAQGFHSKHIVVLVDEGSGVSEFIFEALGSCMTGELSQMIVAYNPLEPGSFVYKAEMEYGWKCIQFNALKHPNVITGREVIPGAITRDFIDGVLRAQTQECDPRYPNAVFIPWQKKFYQKTQYMAVRILGEYNLINHDGFIDAQLVTNSFYDNTEQWEQSRFSENPVFVGIDISRGVKDRTIASILRHDGKMLGYVEFFERNLSVLAEKIFDTFKTEIIAIDDTGVGAGVTDRLNQLGHKCVYPIHFGQSPQNFYQGSLHPTNARTEMYLLIEKGFRNNFLKIPRDYQLSRELTTWRMTSVYGGQYCRVEFKSGIARRLSASPDKSDAFALANYALNIHKRAHQSYYIV